MKTAVKATMLFVSFLLVSSMFFVSDDPIDADDIVVEQIGSGVTLTWNKIRVLPTLLRHKSRPEHMIILMAHHLYTGRV